MSDPSRPSPVSTSTIASRSVGRTAGNGHHAHDHAPGPGRNGEAHASRSLAHGRDERGTRSIAAVRERLMDRLGGKRFERWLGHATLRLKEDGIDVVAEDAFAARWIDRHLSGDLLEVATWAIGPHARVDVRDEGPDAREKEASPAESGEAQASRPPRKPSGSAAANGSGDRSAIPAQSLEYAARLRHLQDFVVGDSNRFAHAAATGLLDVQKGASCPPVFIHGECGVGKTHLLQGVCREAMQRSRFRLRVMYVTAEQFTNEYIVAVRNNSLDRFRLRYRRVDLLAIDDVHFLASKVRTQSEFLHTLDAIDLTGSRVLLASDEHPSLIRRLHRGLVSRFMSGTVAAIERPDARTRRALVDRMLAGRNLQLSDDACQTLASRCTGSVRELEGAMNKLSAMHALVADSGSPARIDRLFVEQIFRGDESRPRRPIRCSDVTDIVCERMQVSRTELMGSSRHRRVVLARSLAAWLIRDLTTMSFPEIARALGRDAHSTVHTAIRRVEQQIERGDQVQTGSGTPNACVRELVHQLRHDVLRSAQRS